MNERTQNMTTRIGVISDTHGYRLPESVHKAFARCDFIIHAGDIGTQAIIDELETIAPVGAVTGNCDGNRRFITQYGSVPSELSIKIESTRLYLAHKPEWVFELLSRTADTDENTLLIHGHTHVPKIEKLPNFTVLCPGSPVKPRGGSIASVGLIEIGPEGLNFVEILSLK